MNAGEKITGVHLDEYELTLRLADGRSVSVPLEWFPVLAAATPQQRSRWHLAGGGRGVHWPELDEDLSAAGLLRGAPAVRTTPA